MPSITLSNSRVIGDYCKPYVVAEVNTSHFGDLSVARKLIDSAKLSGVDCVKFQSWSDKSLYSREYYLSNKISHRIIKKFSFSESQVLDIANYCKSVGIDFASTPYTFDEAKFLVEKCRVPYIKIASMELNNTSFLRDLSSLNFPLILSTGMGDEFEIKNAIEAIRTNHNNFALLHCSSLYPTECSNVNLLNIAGLRQLSVTNPIGFSDHTLGIDIPIASTALGICMLEKHFTLDCTKIGMDNQMATEPSEFKIMINKINEIYSSLGSTQRRLCKEELDQRLKMRRSAVSMNDLFEGHILTENDVEFVRPGDGISPVDIVNYYGQALTSAVSVGHQIRKEYFN